MIVWSVHPWRCKIISGGRAKLLPMVFEPTKKLGMGQYSDLMKATFLLLFIGRKNYNPIDFIRFHSLRLKGTESITNELPDHLMSREVTCELDTQSAPGVAKLSDRPRRFAFLRLNAS